MKNKKRGWFTFHYGGMYGGKTATLIEDAKRLAEIAHRKTVFFVPRIDMRRSRSKVVSLSGTTAPAIQVDDPFEILKRMVVWRTEEVFVDEVQFFRQRTIQDGIEDWSIVFVIKDLLAHGVNVHAAGLNTNFLGHPFPPTTDLMGLANDLVRHRALCSACGDPADWSLRLVDGKPVGPGADLIVVAGTEKERGMTGETYEARCSAHHPFL